MLAFGVHVGNTNCIRYFSTNLQKLVAQFKRAIRRASYFVQEPVITGTQYFSCVLSIK